MKRANGEGTISKRKDGLWIAQLTVGFDTTTGKYKRKCVSGKTQHEAKLKLDKLKKQYKQIAIIENADKYNGNMDFYDFLINHWIPEKRYVERVEETTIATHLQRIESYIKPYFRRVRVDKITPQMIMSFYASLELNALTIKKIHNVINNSLKKAARDGIIPANPAAVVLLPKVHIKEKRSLSDEEVQKLLATAKSYSDLVAKNKNIYPFIVLALTSGLRRGELVGLTWDNIDFRHNKITVEKAVARLTGKTIIKTTKTDASKRTISIIPQVMDILKNHKNLWATGEYVFPSFDDKNAPQHIQGISHIFKSVAVKAEVDCNLHMLRHTHITNIITAGVNLKTVQKRAGHSSIVTTMSYTHPSEEYDREAAEIFSKFV